MNWLLLLNSKFSENMQREYTTLKCVQTSDRILTDGLFEKLYVWSTHTARSYSHPIEIPLKGVVDKKITLFYNYSSAKAVKCSVDSFIVVRYLR